MFYPNFSNEDKVRAYAVFSGVPHYLTLIDDKKSLKENIINLFLKSGANLMNEVDFLLQIEFRKNVANYSSVLHAISKGKTRLNKISQASYINSTAKTSIYLKPLIEMEIVEKEFSFKEENNTRKTIYKIKNNLVNFIYTFIENNKTQKEYLNAEDFYSAFIEPDLDNYVSFIFENACKQFLIRKNKTPLVKDKIIEIGRYWLNDIKTKTQIEIDICIQTLSNKIIVFECKWTNSIVDNKIMNTLQKNADNIKKFKVNEIGAFSRNGFDSNLKNPNLYSLEDIFIF